MKSIETFSNKEGTISFPPFSLDIQNAQLLRENTAITMRPKPFAVLRYLAENPGRLITKEEILNYVWPDSHVSEELLNTYVRDIRKTLEDDPSAPQFIETVVKRGYRFHGCQIAQSDLTTNVLSVICSDTPIKFVGREPELAKLATRLDKAASGQKQIVMVSGEPGVGKTTLVENFLTRLPGNMRIGWGQCVEHYGSSEAFLPALFVKVSNTKVPYQKSDSLR